MDRFDALMISRKEDGEGQEVAWKELTPDDLMDGDVTVRITHTTINYKDGLAITGKAPILRRWPMIPGIDFAGVVESSDHPEFSPGDKVVATGAGLGEAHYGGYSQLARVKGDWLVPLPAPFSLADAMAIGTAGFTAMLCVLALEKHDVAPDKGPIVVTGAAGGVGSVAVAVLAHLGYEVYASTGRPEEEAYLKSLGAAHILDRADLSQKAKPLESERWAGAVDVAGSLTLAKILAQTKYNGTVAACGLAQGMDLPTTVAPFILRNVTLAGVCSIYPPKELRREAWRRLAQDLDMAHLEKMTQTRSWRDVLELAPEILAGKIRGRMVLTVD